MEGGGRGHTRIRIAGVTERQVAWVWQEGQHRGFHGTQSEDREGCEEAMESDGGRARGRVRMRRGKGNGGGGGGGGGEGGGGVEGGGGEGVEGGVG